MSDYRLERSLAGVGKHEIVFEGSKGSETIGEISSEYGDKIQGCLKRHFELEGYNCWGFVRHVLDSKSLFPEAGRPIFSPGQEGFGDLTEDFSAIKLSPDALPIAVYTSINISASGKGLSNCHEGVIVASHDGDSVVVEKDGGHDLYFRKGLESNYRRDPVTVINLESFKEHVPNSVFEESGSLFNYRMAKYMSLGVNIFSKEGWHAQEFFEAFNLPPTLINEVGFVHESLQYRSGEQLQAEIEKLWSGEDLREELFS